jgi:hypothetical protein
MAKKGTDMTTSTKNMNGRGELDHSQMRPVRIAMPARLVRELDLAIQSGAGGYGSRQEFITEAVENHLVEVRFGIEEDSPPDGRARSAAQNEPGKTAAPAKRLPSSDVQLSPEDVRIGVPDGPAPIINEIAVVSPTEPLYGFHNRDIPTIWALERLAEQGPTEINAFYERATADASDLADQFTPWEEQHGVKVTALLPRRSKRTRASAEGRSFQDFALGKVSRKTDNGRLCSGPFFLWGVAGLQQATEGFQIGITDRGIQLLEKLQGLSFEVPHAPAHARTFLNFLDEWAPDDRWGFGVCLTAVADGVDRAGLTAMFHSQLRKDYAALQWKESVANSVAQGYLGRCREWGLVEPGRGEYRLTPFGKEMA